MRRNYSKVIEEMRTPHGLNLVAIGQRIGTDPRTVGKWAQGKHQPPQPAIELSSDIAYIKNRLSELQNMTTMADIKTKLAKTYRIAELMED